MNIVRVTMTGYGCEIARGTMTKKEFKKLEDSNSLDDIWLKELYKKKIKKQIKTINEQFHTIGLISGDIKIEVDGELILELPINIMDNIKTEYIHYPNVMDDVVITTVQHQEGVVCDTIFITDDEFDLNKMGIINKEIENKVDNPLIPSLFSEIRYKGELVPITGTITDLRMSRVFYENEKNNN